MFCGSRWICSITDIGIIILSDVLDEKRFKLSSIDVNGLATAAPQSLSHWNINWYNFIIAFYRQRVQKEKQTGQKNSIMSQRKEENTINKLKQFFRIIKSSSGKWFCSFQLNNWRQNSGRHCAHGLMKFVICDWIVIELCRYQSGQNWHGTVARTGSRTSATNSRRSAMQSIEGTLRKRQNQSIGRCEFFDYGFF